MVYSVYWFIRFTGIFGAYWFIRFTGLLVYCLLVYCFFLVIADWLVLIAYWLLGLYNCGKPWQLVARRGNPWQLVATRGNLWQASGKPAGVARFGNVENITAI